MNMPKSIPSFSYYITNSNHQISPSVLSHSMSSRPDEKSQLLITIIILNWIYFKTTLNCTSDLIQKLIANKNEIDSDETTTQNDSKKQLLKFQILIIENGSPNASWTELKNSFDSKYPKESNCETDQIILRLIKSESNLGFSGGMNFGINLALELKSNYVFLLNNDAYLGETDTINKLVQTSIASVKLNEKKALVGPKLLNSNTKENYFQPKAWPQYLFGYSKSFNSSKPICESAYIEGSALLIPSEFLSEKLLKDGFVFDERFFLYCEDVDLCLSAKKYDYPCLLLNFCSALHEISRSSSNSNSDSDYNLLAYFYITRNRFLLAKKWLPTWGYYIFYVYYFISRFILIFIRQIKNPKKAFPANKEVIHGFIAGLKRQWGQKQDKKCCY